MTCKQKKIINEFTRKIPNLFAAPDVKLTYTTRVIREIRTKKYTPVYTRYYLYPMALKFLIFQRGPDDVLRENI